VAHYVQAYANFGPLRASLEMYRAFPANVQFNRAQHGRNSVPLFLAGGDGSPFAKMIPKIAEGLRASGLTNVETGLIPDSVHYLGRGSAEGDG
jgi:hypothetical protein